MACVGSVQNGSKSTQSLGSSDWFNGWLILLEREREGKALSCSFDSALECGHIVVENRGSPQFMNMVHVPRVSPLDFLYIIQTFAYL